MLLKKLLFTLLFIGVFVLNSFSQNKQERVLLKTIFETIEKTNKVNFNYIDDEVAFFKIIPPNETLILKEKLNYISNITQLEFKFISANYISVINTKINDKSKCAFLYDEITKESINFANIKVLETIFTTTSSEKGYFEISISIPKSVEISHVNYEKIVVDVTDLSSTICDTIFLKPIVNEIDEVIATKIITSGISKKNDGSYEIKPKKFGLLPGLTEPDVFETLKQIPGITSTDETISNLNVRGGTHDQNLFLWNGIRLFQTGHFFGLISALNPNLSQNIKIIKNGSSAFYGESVSSVIDISTHQKNNEKNNFSIGLNLINVDGYAHFKTSKNSSLELSARRSHTDLINSPTYRNYYNRIFQNTAVINVSNNEIINYTNNENFYFYDYSVQFKQKIGSKVTFSLDGISINNLLNLDESKFENGTIVSKKSSLKQNTLGANAALKIDWNKNNTTEINGYGSFYKIISENQSIQTNQIFNQENSILDTGIRLKNSHQISKNIKFNNGYQFNETGIRNVDQVNSPIFFRRVKDVLLIHAGIVEMNYQSENKKLVSTIGVRQNFFQKFNLFITEPRLQLNYKISNHFNLEILAEQKSQVTSQVVDLQQDFLGIEKRRWVLTNNKSIPITKSNQASIGFSVNKNNWLLSLDTFYKKVNGITSRSQGFQNQLEFLKIIGNYTVIGSEFLIQKQFKNFTSSIHYAYSQNEYDFKTFSDKKFPNNFEITHNVAFALIYDYKKIKLALGSKWFTGKPNTLPRDFSPILNNNNQQVIDYNFPNSSQLEAYHQVNFSASKNFKFSKTSHLTFGLSVQNILDSKIIINQNYRINQNTSSVEELNTFSLERTFNGFLRFNI